jgi:hypothetical protein
MQRAEVTKDTRRANLAKRVVRALMRALQLGDAFVKSRVLPLAASTHPWAARRLSVNVEEKELGPREVEGLRDVRRAEVLVRRMEQVLDHCRGGAQKMLSSAVAEAIVASIISTAGE